jgi:hypothetical protein
VKFHAAYQYLTAQGWDVLNPVTLIDDEDCQWKDAMRKCIAEMLTCDAIYMLPCWPKSKGAILERFIAGSVGIKIIEAQPINL